MFLEVWSNKCRFCLIKARCQRSWGVWYAMFFGLMVVNRLDVTGGPMRSLDGTTLMAGSTKESAANELTSAMPLNAKYCGLSHGPSRAIMFPTRLLLFSLARSLWHLKTYGYVSKCPRGQELVQLLWVQLRRYPRPRRPESHRTGSRKCCELYVTIALDCAHVRTDATTYTV